ncbi:protein-glutamate O-methyltransferase CheR [Sphingobacterium sp. LZ11T8]
MFLATLLEEFGYDFTGYSRDSLQRRIVRIMSLWKVAELGGLLDKMLMDPSLAGSFVQQVTVPLTSMFRDPSFFLDLRQSVIPYLSTYPLIRVWIAGCSTGEEAYSMAILLKEAGLIERSLIYATDLNPASVESASNGLFSWENLGEYTKNYLNSGGTMELSDYYSPKQSRFGFNDELRSRMVFSTHNLAGDSSFNSFQLILCRNVLIYFRRSLQESVLELFDTSLENAGFLGLGPKETLRFSSLKGRFQQIGDQKIWQKIN